MTVEVKNPFTRLSQTFSARRVALVSVVDNNGDNTYSGNVLSLNHDGDISQLGELLTLRNLAEQDDVTGKLPQGQRLLVVEFHGQWVTYHPAAMTWFIGRIDSAGGNNIYLVREQVFSASAGNFVADSGSVQLAASNIQELSSPAATPVAVDTLVKVFCVADNSSPANLEYFFDYPV